MKHVSAAQVQYGPVRGIAGVETLSARGLRSGFDRHFHDTYAFGLILQGVERCQLRGAKRLFEPGKSTPRANQADSPKNPATAIDFQLNSGSL